MLGVYIFRNISIDAEEQEALFTLIREEKGMMDFSSSSFYAIIKAMYADAEGNEGSRRIRE